MNSFLCRHSDQISKIACLFGAAFFVAGIFDSLVLGTFLFEKFIESEDLFVMCFIGAWLVACMIIAPIACAVIAYKCYQCSKKYGWKNLAY